MAQQAFFWTYRAGARVQTEDGRLVGLVSAVRRCEVLVMGGEGASAWIPGKHVIAYDGATLTLDRAYVDLAGAHPADSAPPPADRAGILRTLWLTDPTVFDA